MRVGLFLSVAGLLASSAGSGFADTIPIDGSWTEFQFGLAGSFASGCSAACAGDTIDPVAAINFDSPWTFSGPATLTVLDLGFPGDRFDVFDNNVDLGDTSARSGNIFLCSGGIDITCLLNNGGTDLGIYNLGNGNHSITIEVVQNSFDTGGGGAVLSVTASTPEPGTMALLGASIGLIGLWRLLRFFLPG